MENKVLPIHLFFKRGLITLMIFLSCFSTRASHIVGADLFYTHVAGNTYKVTFIAYGDCGPASSAAFSTLPSSRPVVCIYDGNTYISSISLTIDTPATPYLGHEITPVCPADTAMTQCTNTAFAIPGIKKFVYTGTYTMPYTSHTWRFLYVGGMGPGSGAGRAAAITNIVSGTSIALVDTLDNTYHNNSSPILTVVPTPFFCLNNPDSYNPGAVDPDGDSLQFFLVPGKAGNSNCMVLPSNVTYTGTYTATAPLSVSAGTFSFSQSTGQLNFTPNITQRSLVVYNIEEFRHDTLIGTSQREMTFLVIVCTNPPPTSTITTASAGTLTGPTSLSICSSAGAFTMTTSALGSTATVNVFVNAGGLPAGSTFTTVNDSTNNPVSTFTWTTTGVAPGTYSFFVTYNDDNCPINGTRTISFTITILPLPTVSAGPDAAICIGNSTVLNAAGGVSYSWSPATGLSCLACGSPTASPIATTDYTVTGTGANGCTNTDDVVVTVNPLPTAIAGPTAVCVGSTVVVTDATAGGTWSSSAIGTASITGGGGVVSGVLAGVATLTYTLPTSCYVTENFTVNPLPVAIAGPASVCAGSTINMTDASGGGTWPSGSTSIATIDASTGVLTGVAAGSATISYTLPTTCYITTNVTVNPMPASITGPATVCVGSTIALVDVVPGGTWTSSAAGTASVAATGVVTGVTAGAATITYTLPAGCYVTYNITVNPLPAAIGGPAAVCAGATIVETDANAGGTWSSSNTSLATFTGTSTVAGVANGNLLGVAAGTPTITYSLATGCYITRVVTVNPMPSAIGGPSSVCVGATINLTNTLAGGTWTSGAPGIASVVGATGVVTGVATGTATINYAMLSGCNVNTTITVNPLPNAGTITGTTNLCVGNTEVLTESVGGGTWSATGPFASISAGGTVTAISAGLEVISYTVTNVCGTAVAVFDLNLIAFPTVGTISGPSSACVGNTVSLTETSTTGLWTITNPAIASISATNVVSALSAGTAGLTYTVTNFCGSVFSTFNFTSLPVPTISVTPPSADICIGNNTTLAASGAFSYSWSPAADLSSPTLATVTATPTLTTTYTVVGVAANTCVGSTEVVVTVHALPAISVPNVTVCRGTPAVLVASGASTYVWSPVTALSSSTGVSVTSATLVSTTYSIVGTDIFGCVNSSTVNVTVNPIPPAPGVVSPVIYCKNAFAVPLPATGIGLLWYTTPTVGGGSAAAPTPSTVATDTVDYYVTQTINGCESPQSDIQVQVLQDAIADFSYTIKYGCTRDTVTFTNNSQFSSSFQWTFGDGLDYVGTDVNPVYYYPTAYVNTNYTVKLLAISQQCFNDSMSQVITVTPSPTATFVLNNVSPTQTIAYGASIQLNAFGGVYYMWKPDDGSLNNPNISDPIATPQVTTLYTVYAYNFDGCLDSAYVNIIVGNNDTEFIPAGFTPNGDGVNDIFRIAHLKFDKLLDFSIYNRWGQQVFNTQNIENGWDGRFNGEPQDLGVYNYVIIVSHVDGQLKTYKGTVTLIR